MATAGDRRGAGPERAHAPALGDHLAPGSVITLSPEESRHLVRARRVAVGSTVVLFDGSGTLREACLETADARAARLAVGAEAPARTPDKALRIALSPPEGGRMDQLVGQLAELGVLRILPLGLARTPKGRLDATARRQARFERIAIEALKVNGAAQQLVVEDACAWPELLATADPAATFLLDPDPGCAPLSGGSGKPAGPTVVLGPEGGFTEAERDAALDAGWSVRRLGATALRIETAAVAAAAVVLCDPAGPGVC